MGGALQRHVGKADLRGGAADQVGDGDRAEAKIIGGECIHAVGEAQESMTVGCDHGVEIHAVELQAEVAEGVDVVLEVLAELFDGSIRQQRAEAIADRRFIEHFLDGAL